MNYESTQWYNQSSDSHPVVEATDATTDHCALHQDFYAKASDATALVQTKAQPEIFGDERLGAVNRFGTATNHGLTTWAPNQL